MALNPYKNLWAPIHLNVDISEVVPRKQVFIRRNIKNNLLFLQVDTGGVVRLISFF